ncbi:Protoporphyrinogen oxidase [Linderina pennispora]|uniref:Protoporphyrinogen oxidase n=1 Tax=Linderina pennispora TaxID=61395 RepID=A0A1Y1W3B2_9FUNG|nr:Protoporphyrinogen oxidase [Linderina pennispora]ORX67785.1 Protoporphyrinogen oxidase [Linderina pennispora]
MAAQQAARNTAVTVLGGGISGLSTAYYLAQRLPSTAMVTLIEGSQHVGGWVRSERRQIGSGVSALAEKGPRTLRTGESREALAVLELVDDLDLRDSVVTASRESAAAQNRYIYYNRHLNRMPTGIGSLVTGVPAAVRCLAGGVWQDLFTRKNTPEATDESIHEFISRRFGRAVDDNLASAVMHGIYAADTKDLSARALLYPFWLADQTGKHGVIRGLRRVAKLSRARHARFAQRDAEERVEIAKRRVQNRGFWDMMGDASMYSFEGGLQTLTDRLLADLTQRPNVEILRGTPAQRVRLTADNAMAEVGLADGRVVRSHHVVNALPLPQLKTLFSGASPALVDETPYASVSVANVTYAKRSIAPIDGFGYLVPRASSHDSAALGVVLDSCALPQQDGNEEISRLTVMLGGATRDSAQLEQDALETLRKHLGISETPADIDITVARECIPTYTVGYVDRLRAMHEWVAGVMQGRMSVVGAAYGGPAVPHCVLHARDLVQSLNLNALTAQPLGVTGLEEIMRSFE